MKILNSIGAILFLLIFESANYSFSQTVHRIRRIGIEDGLSSSTVLSIAKDKYGYMWFGTDDGLNRFDGNKMTVYTSGEKSGLSSAKNVTALYTDSSGILWVACGNYVSRYSYEDDRFSLVAEVDNTIDIRSMVVDDNNNIWAATSSGLHILRRNISDSEYREHILERRERRLGNKGYNQITRTSGNLIWLAADEGMLKIYISGADTLIARYYYVRTTLADRQNAFYGSVQDTLGNFWFATRMGLIKVDEAEAGNGWGQYMFPCNPLRFEEPDDGLIQPDVVFNVCYDGSRFVFLRTLNGVYSMDVVTGGIRKLSGARLYQSQAAGHGNVIKPLFLDSENHIVWTSSENGIEAIDIREPVIISISHDQANDQSLGSDIISEILVDHDNNLWVGTEKAGLNKGTPVRGISEFLFERFEHQKDDAGSIAGNNICSIAEPVPGKIFIAAGNIQEAVESKRKTLFRTNPYNVNIPPDYLRNPRITYAFAGNFIWTLNPGYGTFLSDTLTGKSYDFYLNNQKVLFPGCRLTVTPDSQIFINSFKNIMYRIKRPLLPVDSQGFRPSGYEALCDTDRMMNFITDYIITVKDSTKYFWFSTMNYGLLKYRLREPDPDQHDDLSKKARLVFDKAYKKSNGLADDEIVDLIEDRIGRIWVTTMNGLSCLDQEKDRIFNFSDADGLPGNKFNHGAATDKDGKLFFSNLNGLVVFDPSSLINEYSDPSIVISRIKIFNKSENPGNSGVMEPAVVNYRKIILPHNQNMLSFELGSFNYMSGSSLTYMYKMDGVDDDWIDGRGNSNISYGYLKSGRYRLHAISVSKNGLRKSEEVILDIEIKRPFYLNLWFIFPVMIVLLTLAYLLVKFREKNLRARSQWLEKQVQQKAAVILQQRDEVDKMKTRFFTNISHEFRTPLTLILSSSDELSKGVNEPARSHFFDTIRNSSHRLLNLVNELLDFSKLEAGRMQLKAVHCDISAEMRLIWQNYLSEAERRKISLSFLSEPESIEGWFDREFLHKIMDNLISNALKFTPDEEKVSIRLSLGKSEKNEEEVVIIINDTGKGILPEHLDKIFDRFYQVEDHENRSIEGTGIGLAIVKELVQRHYGKIDVESKPGEGTTFTIILPVGKEHLKPDEIYHKDNNQAEVGSRYILTPGSDAKPSGDRVTRDFGKASPQILIAEDNYALRNYLAEILGKKYNIKVAANGKEAFDIASGSIPDLIVSDIMMPDIDGIELCRIIKQNGMTSHIPVILLTARADMESKLEGLKAEADDYLIKPFNNSELFARIENLLNLRRKLKEKFSVISFPEKSGLKSRDEEFLLHVIEKIEANIVRIEFSVKELADEMHVSHRSLQRKIFALTNRSPLEFMRGVRIKYAARLILEKGASVTEAAYASGFSSLSYFSRVFREITGASPHCYRNKNG